MSILVLLALSAAFKSDEHFLERLEHCVGLTYAYDVGSTLGFNPVTIFNLYKLPLCLIMRNNIIAYHCYAEDTQIYIALSPTDYRPIDLLCQCIEQNFQN